MGLFNFWRSDGPARPAPSASGVPQIRADVGAFYDMEDPRLIEFMRAGSITESGAAVTVDKALKNTTVFRCVSLISYTIGMLPLHLYVKGDARAKAEDHPLFRLLYSKPNGWQSAFDFRSLMQSRALVNGDSYALAIRSRGETRQLIPMDPQRVTVKQRADWTVQYEIQMPDGGKRTFPAEEILHIRGLSQDGLKGTSLVKVAAEAIGLAMQTERAAARLFRNGMMVGGAFKHKSKLSPEAYDRLKASLDERFSGAENAHKWLILEEDMDAATFANTMADSQHIETRKNQVEEIGRAFGVPRPLLMVDDTSWGSGIDVLGQFFVRYGLQPWFTAWEQAIERTLLTEDEQGKFYAKFNAGALIRGSMKDQAEFFAKGLGAGGHEPFLHPDEVRAWLELGPRDDLPTRPGTPEKPNDTAQPA